ncbi:MAG: type II CAAX endopeptidase family protein, partial [Maricaulis sp.]|nr:type II CAAX endopeptidase family protein [Maricaulis sp.]
MNLTPTQRRDAWINIALFLFIVTILSAIFHYAITQIRPTSLYVGPLMWSPAVAAFLTMKLRGRNISTLPWEWGKWRFNIGAYLMPVVYIGAAYLAIWSQGLGGVPDPEGVAEWANDLGLENLSSGWVITIMIAIMATLGCIRAMSTIVGEEIGWRGFFIWELRKVMPFGAVAIFSGVVWSMWHWPIIIAYGGGDTLIQIADFTVLIVAMSVIMAYFTFKSKSLWPAVMFHAAHNV